MAAELAVQPEKAVAGFGAKLVAYNQIIHEGRILGRFGTFLVMLAGFAMPAFYVTGWMMYLKRRRARRAA